MSLKEKITELLVPLLKNDSFFIVDIQLSPSKVRQKVVILVDSDAGISIDECAAISRQLGNILEEQEIIADAFTLEVSSPGVDFPLAMPRQFLKNVGRKLRVVMKDGTEKVGMLMASTNDGISLLPDVKRKKKDEVVQEIAISYPEIAKAEVQITFS
jgi:ribosome maturation factor RimP